MSRICPSLAFGFYLRDEGSFEKFKESLLRIKQMPESFLSVFNHQFDSAQYRLEKQLGQHNKTSKVQNNNSKVLGNQKVTRDSALSSILGQQSKSKIQRGRSPGSQMNKVNSMLHLKTHGGDTDSKAIVDDDEQNSKSKSAAMAKENEKQEDVDNSQNITRSGERNIVYLNDEDSDGFEII